jgi:hypothetical protein
VKESRAALSKRLAAETASKLAVVGAIAVGAKAAVKNLPFVGGAIAGVITLFQMGMESHYVGQQARAAAKDILHDLTYSYLLFKLIDIGADRLGLVLDIETIQEGIKDINEKVKEQFAPRPSPLKDPRNFMNYATRNPKAELELLHKSLDEFRNNMVDLYTSFDVLKKTDELLPTLTDAGKQGKRYTRISPENIEILISWFKTAAARELDDNEVSEVMKFLEQNMMTLEERKAKNETLEGKNVVPDPDKTFATASENAAQVVLKRDIAAKKAEAEAAAQEARLQTENGMKYLRAYGIPTGGALWPPKYYRGLSTRRKGQRRREITRRAKMSWKNPSAYRPFATDRGTKRRPSSYSSRFHTKYPGVTTLPAIANATHVPVGVLTQVYNRGMAAWRTGHRPGASQHAWGMARVHSFVLHGKTWRTADADLARQISS